jgi:hypothetical protein
VVTTICCSFILAWCSFILAWCSFILAYCSFIVAWWSKSTVLSEIFPHVYNMMAHDDKLW